MHPWLRWLFIYALPVLVVAGFTYWNRHYQMDDALIYLRYVRNFHEGLGLVYNPDEYFNAVTSPLFLYLLLCLSLLINDLQLTSMLLCGASLAGTALIGSRLYARSEMERCLTAVAIASVAYFHANFGMESMLFILLISLSLYLYKNHSDYFVLALVGVALTRLEGVILAAVLGLHYLYINRRLPDWRLLIVAFCLFALPFLFNYFYYGAWLPATAAAKIGQGQSGLWGEGWLFLKTQAIFYIGFLGNAYAVFLSLFLFMAGVYSERHNPLAQLGLLFAVVLALVYTLFNVANYNWYYVPLVFLYLLLACRGFAFVVNEAASIRKSQPIGTTLMITAFMSLIVIALNTVKLWKNGPLPHYQTIGNWLAQNTSVNSSIGLVEVGTVGWYSRRRLVDILGLVSPDNASHIAKVELYHWITYDQPDYLVGHDPLNAHETSIRFLTNVDAYHQIEGPDVPGYQVLMKNPELTDAQIVELAWDKITSRKFVGELEENYHATSGHDSPVYIEILDRIVVHVPSNLMATVPARQSSLTFQYGLEPWVAELHHGVCFFLEADVGKRTLLNDCIGPGTQEDNLQRSFAADLAADKPTRLTFRTACISDCEYAQAYWSNLLLQ